MSSLDDQVETALATGPNINRVRTLGSVCLTREGTDEHILFPRVCRTIDSRKLVLHPRKRLLHGVCSVDIYKID
jgi:hypothetical protein